MGVKYYLNRKEKVKMVLITVWGLVWCGLGYSSGILTMLKMIGIVKV